ncbi:MAG: hypothetical protein JO108_14520 [Acidobacteriaceae bacterium]|nr:hypothetical protein [Acidobacteriaceae bacterium]
MENRKIVAAVTDLMFRVRISDAAKRLGVQVTFVGDQGSVLREAASGPDMILFDLDCEATRPVQTISAIKNDPSTKGVLTVGFVSHVHTEKIKAAQQAGCDKVLARSAFVQRLGETLSGEFEATIPNT